MEKRPLNVCVYVVCMYVHYLLTYCVQDELLMNVVIKLMMSSTDPGSLLLLCFPCYSTCIVICLPVCPSVSLSVPCP